MPSAPKADGNKISIAVVENDPLRFVGLRTILESEKDFVVRASDVSGILNHVHCDVILLGAHGELGVYDLIGTLKALRNDVRVIVTGAPSADEKILRAISAGAKGYVDETARPDEYKQAIRVVHSGSVWAPRRVLSKFIERVTSNPANSTMDNLSNFSERERQVLELLIAGRTNKEIGVELGIEERTVKAHITKLMHKAGVDNRIALSVHALTHSLVAGS